MRMIPVEEIKSIDVENRESDKCPFGLHNQTQDQSAYIASCITNRCMAWYWTSVGENTGCCALIYKPETIEI